MVQVMAGDNLAVARLDSVTLSQELFGGPIGKDDPTIFRKEQKPDAQLVQRLLGLMLMDLAGAYMSVHPQRACQVRNEPAQDVDI
jgi:hypothetical protein